MLDLGLTKQDYFWMAQTGVLGVVGILVVLLVARPLVNNLFAGIPEAAGAAANAGSGVAQLTDQTGGAPAALPPPAPSGPAPAPISTQAAEAVAAAQQASAKRIGDLVEQNPEEAVAVMRNWMQQEA